jgi:tetratricopeptide (TPR) repeat protein
VEELLAWIRLSGWDAGIFLGCAPVLMKHAGTASGLLRREIHRAVHEVWSAHFPLPEVRDLAFELGVLLCEIQCYEDALGFFRQSAGLHGSNPATVFNMGLCLFHLGDLEAARVYTQQAIDAAPDYAPAAALREEIAAAARFEDALP